MPAKKAARPPNINISGTDPFNNITKLYQTKLKYTDKKIKIAQSLAEQADSIISEENLELKKVFRKGYVNYKYGRSSVFWIDMWSTAANCIIVFYLEKEPDHGKAGIDIEKYKTKWQKNDNMWQIQVEDPTFDLRKLLSVIKASYKYIID